MINPESYKALLQQIVEIHFPDESDSFELGGDIIVSQAMLQEQDVNQNQREPYCAVDLGTAKIVLELIVVAFSGWKVISEMIEQKKQSKIIEQKKQLKESFLKEYETRLEKLLIESHKINPKKVKAISRDFIREAERMIE